MLQPQPTILHLSGAAPNHHAIDNFTTQQTQILKLPRWLATLLERVGLLLKYVFQSGKFL